jgi:hypothetical protein
MRLALALLVAATPALAEGDLTDRTVTLRTLAYDDPARPIYDGQGRTVIVGQGVEFGMGPEGSQNGLDVVPVQVDLFPRRIEFTYPGVSGAFATAAFNGYVLTFPVDCALFEGAVIDPAFTNMPLAPDALTVLPQELRLNVSGLTYAPGLQVAIDLQVTDCPLS